MLVYMLDTNICIRVLRDRPAEARPRFNAEAGRICISTITLNELFHGAAKSARPTDHERAVEQFAARLTVLPFEHHAAAHAGDIRATLERAGTTIGPYDSLIAGHARSQGLIVVTGNVKEFQRVPGLRCEDWLPPTQTPGLIPETPAQTDRDHR